MDDPSDDPTGSSAAFALSLPYRPQQQQTIVGGTCSNLVYPNLGTAGILGASLVSSGDPSLPIDPNAYDSGCSSVVVGVYEFASGVADWSDASEPIEKGTVVWLVVVDNTIIPGAVYCIAKPGSSFVLGSGNSFRLVTHCVALVRLSLSFSFSLFATLTIKDGTKIRTLSNPNEGGNVQERSGTDTEFFFVCCLWLLCADPGPGDMG